MSVGDVGGKTDTYQCYLDFTFTLSVHCLYSHKYGSLLTNFLYHSH